MKYDRKFLVRVIVWLKADMHFSKKCEAIRDRLLGYLSTGNYFDPSFRRFFDGGVQAIPYKILPDDPTQVASLKKILNAFSEAATGFKHLENLDIRSERYTAGIIKDFALVTYKSIHKLYSAVEMINLGGTDIERFVGPQLSGMVRDLQSVATSLDTLTSETSEVSEDKHLRLDAKAIRQDPGGMAAKAFAKVVGFLPEEEQSADKGFENLSHIFFELPKIFEDLRIAIATGESDISLKARTTSVTHQKVVLEKALKDISERHTLFALPAYYSALKAITTHSSDLLSTAAPLTKQTYLDAVDTLNIIRHDYLPILIAELERTEENMALKPGTLVAPAITKMQAYYSELASYVEMIAVQAGYLDDAKIQAEYKLAKTAFFFLGANPEYKVGEVLTPVKGLRNLADEGFDASLRAKRALRLAEAKIEKDDHSALDAADRFFRKLATHRGFGPQSVMDRLVSLAQFSSDEKLALLSDYKLFHKYLCELNPELDKLIIEMLTTSQPRTWLSRINLGGLKDLYANHFAAIMALEGPVRVDIQQAIAQGDFKVKLIEHGGTQREAVFYDARHHKTQLVKTVPPFAGLASICPEGRPATYYHEQRVLFLVQLQAVNDAKKAMKGFFNTLRDNHPHENPKFVELDEGEKEELRRFYLTFQSHVVAEDRLAKLNDRLVEALMSSDPENDLRIADLNTMHTQLVPKFDEWIHQTTQYVEDFAESEHDAILATEITPLGSELAKKTLFAKLEEIKISKKVAAFITINLREFYAENLDRDVFRKLEFNKLPLLNMHTLSPEVKVHQQIINTLHFVQQTLEKLEIAGASGDPNGIYYRTKYIINILKLVFDVVDAKRNLERASANPGLSLIMGQALNILEPLKYLPLIGNYFQPKAPVARSEAPVVLSEVSRPSIVTLWQQQQDILRRARSMEAMVDVAPVIAPPAEEPEAEEAPLKPAVSYLRMIGEQLFKMPLAVKKSLRGEGDAEVAKDEAELAGKINDFVSSLNGFSWETEYLKSILKTVGIVNEQVTSMGADSRALVMQSVDKLPETVGAKLVGVADTAEFELGLKPGTLSKQVRDQFKAFYATLVTQLPHGQDQQALTARLSTSLTKARIAQELTRQALLSEHDDSLEYENVVFDSAHPDKDKINALFQQLEEVQSPLMEKKHLLIKIYSKIYPYLLESNQASMFREDYITSSIQEDDLEGKIAELEVMQLMLTNRLGAFSELKNLFDFDVADEGFTTENQEKFLTIYERLQPYLVRINVDYDTASFLRSLETPEDFIQETQKILKLESQLHEVVDTHRQSHQERLVQCSRRLEYLQAEFREEDLAKDVEVDAFKFKILSDHVTTTVKNRLDTALGHYVDVFLCKFLSQLRDPAERILEGLTLEDNIEDEVATRVQTREKALLSGLEPFKRAFSGLNDTLLNLSSLELPVGYIEANPARVEMQRELHKALQHLKRADAFKVDSTIEDIAIERQYADKMVLKMREYLVLARCSDLLLKMMSHLAEDPTKLYSRITQAKVQETHQLMGMLCDETQAVSTRLRHFKERVTSQESQDALLKNSDNFIVRILKSLWSLITGWKSPEEKMVIAVKRQLSLFREESVKADVRPPKRDAPEVPGMDVTSASHDEGIDLAVNPEHDKDDGDNDSDSDSDSDYMTPVNIAPK